MDNDRKRVLVAYGTRPEAIKMAPVVQAMQRSDVLEPIVAVSAEDSDGVEQVNALFDIVPHVEFDGPEPEQSLGRVVARGLDRYASYLEQVPIDAVAVQGDTATALAASLGAFYSKVPVVHVEAGLRSGYRYLPFPEEINRRLTAQVATLHLAPTSRSRDNLISEGVPPGETVVTGNTVVDALLFAASLGHPTGDRVIDDTLSQGQRIVLVTTNRRESWGDELTSIGTAVARIAQSRPELLIVLPVRRNALVREHLLPPVQEIGNVRITEPLAYGAFARLLSKAALVLTDSGGVQEEAPSFGVPVLVMRDTTERPEAVTARAAKLVGTRASDIVDQTIDLLEDDFEYQRMSTAGSPFGDGSAGERSRAAIAHFLGVGTRWPDFSPDGSAQEAAMAS